MTAKHYAALKGLAIFTGICGAASLLGQQGVRMDP